VVEGVDLVLARPDAGEVGLDDVDGALRTPAAMSAAVEDGAALTSRAR
jgi:hypothetical protein